MFQDPMEGTDGFFYHIYSERGHYFERDCELFLRARARAQTARPSTRRRLGHGHAVSAVWALFRHAFLATLLLMLLVRCGPLVMLVHFLALVSCTFGTSDTRDALPNITHARHDVGSDTDPATLYVELINWQIVPNRQLNS